MHWLVLLILLLKKLSQRAKRDELAVKNCSFRGPGFKLKHPHSNSQLSVTPAPGDLIATHRHTCRQKNNAHKIKTNKFTKTKKESMQKYKCKVILSNESHSCNPRS